MKHILLITFYFPPYTGIEGNRLNSWARELSEAGFKVTVLTRQWKQGGQNTWADYVTEYSETEYAEEIINNKLRVIRVPHRWTAKYKATQKTKIAGLYYWYDKLFGRFHLETDAYNSFYKAAQRILRTDMVDLIIVSSPPLNIIRLGHELKKETKIPFLADFRDSYNNHKLNPNFRHSVKQRAESYLFKKYLNHWLINADAIVTVDKAVADTINKNFSQPVLVIRNGFETDLFKKNDVPSDKEVFRLTVTGNLYPEQDIAFLARGIGKFITDIKPKSFKAQFIGLRDNPTVVEILRRYIPDANLFLAPRQPRIQALEIMSGSQILLQAGWRDYKGWIPGKVYEYMAAGKNILIAPGDGDILDRVIQETGTGFSAHTVDSMANYLEEKYIEWQLKGKLTFNGNMEIIKKYSREAQNARLITFIKDFLI